MTEGKRLREMEREKARERGREEGRASVIPFSCVFFCDFLFSLKDRDKH